MNTDQQLLDRIMGKGYLSRNRANIEANRATLRKTGTNVPTIQYLLSQGLIFRMKAKDWTTSHIHYQRSCQMQEQYYSMYQDWLKECC